MPISEQQARILEYVRTRLAAGACPTIREIMGEFGLSSTSVVQHHLRRLQARGLLDRTSKVSRGLAIPGAAYVAPDAPVVVVVDGREVVGTFARLAA